MSNIVIPIVDLSSSQEDDEPVGRGREKRKEVVNIVEHATPKKQRLSDQFSRSDCEGLHQRLSLVENLVTREANNSSKNEPSKEEFEKLVARVSGIENRLHNIEQFIHNVSNFFRGMTLPIQSFNKDTDQNSDCSKEQGTLQRENSPAAGSMAQAGISFISGQAGPSSEATPTRTVAAPQRRATEASAIRNTSMAGPSSQVTPNRTVAIPQRRTTEASAIPNTSVGKSSGVSISKARTPTTKPATGTGHSVRSTLGKNTSSNAGSSLTITPVSPQNSTVSVTATSASRTPIGTAQKAQTNGNRNQNAATPSGSGISDKQSQQIRTSIDVANLSQILSEKKNLEENEDVPYDIYKNIPIKKELFEAPAAPTRNQYMLLPKDNENRYNVYVRGEARKVRNQDIYTAAYGWNVGGVRTKSAVHYRSEIQTATVRKQAEILAAIFAVEDLKLNSGETGPLMITIVTNYNKIIQTMTNIRSIYRLMDTCTCPQHPCGHSNRWETHDLFAKTFNDDLPKLVLATRGVDVKWRTYEPMDVVPEIELKSVLKATLRSQK